MWKPDAHEVVPTTDAAGFEVLGPAIAEAVLKEFS